MEPVVQPPEVELHLLTDWSDPDARSRHRKAAAGAILVNVTIIVTLCVLPDSVFKPPELPEPPQRVTPLILPPLELTQKEPNNGKVTGQFEVQAPEAPRRGDVISSPAPTKRAAAKPPAPVPPPPVVQPPQPVVLPDPPKVETARETPPPELPRPVQQNPTLPPPPQPQIQAAEKPKLTFESPPTNTGPVPPEQRVIPMPTTSIDQIAKEATRGVASPIGLTIGDQEALGSAYNGMSQSPAPGNPLAAVQIRSDPGGVDWKPYLNQILATIKRNWLAVIPESARRGQRGKVAVLFEISNAGIVGKVAYAEQSGSRSLDFAAVTGVTSSNPLPPLPREFKGQRIVLQLNFVYK